MEQKTKQEIKVYKTGFSGSAQQQFERDQKRRVKQGWRLVSVQQTQRRSLFTQDALTAIWEK